MSSGFVCLMGIGIVFVGLISLVIICSISSFFVTRFTKGEKVAAKPDNATVNAAAIPAKDINLSAEEKRAILAGVCAVIADELGTDASNIRVCSFKRA